ncbi:MAG TPA: FGGY-family carbohydrate kinase [Acidimicrobiales bacterium]|nr:FGGY-family carbohydrate kinase [Acidimicrobiales bacterium]
MSESNYVLSIDLGTGGPKVALFADDGSVVAHSFAPVKLQLLAGGGAENDPDEWWSAISSCAREVTGAGHVPVDRIVAVGCTAQWSGTVAVGADGNHLMNSVIWMDSRGNGPIRKVAGGGPVKVMGYDVRKVLKWIKLTGGGPSLSGKDPIAHILFIKEAFPDIYKQTDKFLEPCDYLSFRLTGRMCASYDSITLHWVTDNRKIDKIDYHPGLLAMSGLDRSKLPDLVPSASIVGKLSQSAADDLGVPSGIPVASATGDIASAAVGSGAVRDFESHLYIGTSSWITCHVPFKKTSIATNIGAIPSAIPGKYMVADEHETAGACLNFLKDSLLLADDELSAGKLNSNPYETFGLVAGRAEPGSGNVIFTPWLNGERSPVDDHTVRAGFHNLSLSTNRAQIVRSVFEGVAYNSRWLLGAVDKFIGRRIDTLSFIGGGANSDLWSQIHADVTGRNIKQMADPVLANARGAALLALLAIGKIDVEAIGSMVPVKKTYRPDPAVKPVYDELYSEFVNIYKANKPIYKRLNKF